MREGSPGQPAAKSHTTGQAGCGLQKARSHRTKQPGCDSSQRASHKAEHLPAMLSIRSSDRVMVRQVAHDEGFMHDCKWPQVQARGRQEDQRSPSESPAGLSTTLLSTSHRLPSSPATQSIGQCLLPAPSHLDQTHALSLGMAVPLLFILTPPICDRRLHPRCTGAMGRPPGVLRVGVTCARAGSPSALQGASPQCSPGTRRGS